MLNVPAGDIKMNMIEKVARALCAHNYNNLNEDMIERIVETCWKAYIPSAAVAIKAMKEPTEEMLKVSEDHAIGINYKLMIEAALKE